MRYSKYLLSIIAVIFAFGFMFQDDPNNPNNMTKEEWQRQMTEYTSKRRTMESQLNSINAQMNNLSSKSKSLDYELSRAETELYSAAGSTKEGVAAFRTKFEEVERKMNAGETYNNLKTPFAEVETSKIKCLPEFYDRYSAMKVKMQEMAPKKKTTTQKKTTTEPVKKKKVRKRKGQQ